MFLANVIHNQRLKLHLTQTELAQDICTQNTISKIEKHSIAPIVNILLKLCLRLDVTLNDVFSEFAKNRQNGQSANLRKIEKLVLLRQPEAASKLFDSIQAEENQKVVPGQYLFLTGAIQYLNNQYDDATFSLNKSLQETKSDIKNVYTVLDFAFIGLAYVSLKHQDRADYYFKLIENSLNNLPATLELEVTVKFFLYKIIAENAVTNHNLVVAKKYTNLGFAVIRENQSVLFVADFYHLAANQVENKKSQRYRDNIAAEKFY